jgi:hypothetical protein
VFQPNQLPFTIKWIHTMKRLLLLLPFLCPLMLAAQVEFAPLGATWYFEDNSPPLPWKLAYIKVEVTGIDTIQGRACKRIESKHILGGSDWGCSFYAPLLHTFQKNGLVYANHDGDFHLLYDFDALAGESWVIPNPPIAWGDSLVVVVDSVSFVTVNGNVLKVQHVSNPGLGPGELLQWGSEIIEGIGNTGYITPQYPTCDPWIYGLRCYEDDSLDLHFVTFPCDSTKSYVATQAPVLRGGFFTPNPVTGNTVVLSEEIDADRVVLQNTLGAPAKTFLLSQGHTLEIENIEPGVYFATLFLDARLVGTDKLVVLRR